jgi:hypothetical protein
LLVVGHGTLSSSSFHVPSVSYVPGLTTQHGDSLVDDFFRQLSAVWRELTLLVLSCLHHF